MDSESTPKVKSDWVNAAELSKRMGFNIPDEDDRNGLKRGDRVLLWSGSQGPIGVTVRSRTEDGRYHAETKAGRDVSFFAKNVFELIEQAGTGNEDDEEAWLTKDQRKLLTYGGGLAVLVIIAFLVWRKMKAQQAAQTAQTSQLTSQQGGSPQTSINSPVTAGART